MTSRAPNTFRHIVHGGPRSNSNRSLQMFPPERCSALAPRRGGPIPATRKFTPSPARSTENRLTKLLVNVNIEKSLGAVQVIMLPENTVRDLRKAAIEIYVKEKRRPLLKDTNPDAFQLHYSQFSLESLKAEEKLINLESRNFFMCSKPETSLKSSCSQQTKIITAKSTFPLIKLMEFLL